MQRARLLAFRIVLVVLGLALPAPTAMSIPVPRPLESPPIQIAEAPPATETEPLLPAITWDLPVTRNERVDFWIRWLSGHNRARTALWLERSGRYAPMTREKLRERGMPEDLVYLALIESGFLPSAVSRAKAVGLWQFIAETGRRYGLKVTPYVDDRLTR